MPRRRFNALRDLVRALPARQLIHLWLAIFSTFSSIGLVLDILTGGRQPAALLALNVISPFPPSPIACWPTHGPTAASSTIKRSC